MSDTVIQERHFTFASENDRSPWDTLVRLAAEVGWELDEPDNCVVVARPIPSPRVRPVTQGRIMASQPVPSPTRQGASREDYMRAICGRAGVEFRGPSS